MLMRGAARNAYRNYYECHVNAICFHFQYVMSKIYPGFKFVVSSFFSAISLVSFQQWKMTQFLISCIAYWNICVSVYVYADDIKMGTKFKSQNNIMGCDVKPIENFRKTNESWNRLKWRSKMKKVNLFEQQWFVFNEFGLIHSELHRSINGKIME